mgnify:CR=1 FL=1
MYWAIAGVWAAFFLIWAATHVNKCRRRLRDVPEAPAWCASGGRAPAALSACRGRATLRTLRTLRTRTTAPQVALVFSPGKRRRGLRLFLFVLPIVMFCHGIIQVHGPPYYLALLTRSTTCTRPAPQTYLMHALPY